MPLARFNAIVLALTSFLSACGTVAVVTGVISSTKPETEPYVRPAPEYAMPAGPNGAFAGLESEIRTAHGPEASGFELIDSNEDGLRWRLALIDSARQSIDLQYYLWYGDAAGRLLVKRLLDAADRGVKVRVLVDDLNTAIQTATSVSLRDKVAAWMDKHPNVQVRVFNPWKKRDLVARVSESIYEMKRVNQRMHNKALIVDNQAAILGGRNLGDEYMGLHSEFNFHDLDVLGIGPVARQTSTIFDTFWNSEWAIPVWALKIPITPTEQAEGREKLLKYITNVKSLDRFPLPPQSWSAEFAALPGRWHIGTSKVYSDLPTNGTIHQLMIEKTLELIASPQRELLIVNAYIIPTERGMKTLRTLKDRGVSTRILTNSLASQDVPAVNSHYKAWRKPILEAGAELYEMRHDAAIQSLVSDTLPTHAKFMGLHSKGMVIDRGEVFIGSMNLDPRSALINTEMGVVIKSPGLAEALTKLIERDMQPANSWRVELNGDGELRWVNDKETVTRQPARNWWQRVEDVFFQVFPKEYY
jgi:putative cardiolipin synthase